MSILIVIFLAIAYSFLLGGALEVQMDNLLSAIEYNLVDIVLWFYDGPIFLRNEENQENLMNSHS